MDSVPVLSLARAEGNGGVPSFHGDRSTWPVWVEQEDGVHVKVEGADCDRPDKQLTSARLSCEHQALVGWSIQCGRITQEKRISVKGSRDRVDTYRRIESE